MLSVYKTFTLRYNKVIYVSATCTHYIKIAALIYITVRRIFSIEAGDLLDLINISGRFP